MCTGPFLGLGESWAHWAYIKYKPAQSFQTLGAQLQTLGTLQNLGVVPPPLHADVNPSVKDKYRILR